MGLHEIFASSGDNYEYVYAESFPAAMEVLAHWAPAVQGAAIATLIGTFDDPPANSVADLIRTRLK